MASTDQDLSDLADVVLTKLRESDGADAHPLIVQFVARVVSGRQMDQAHTTAERVWLNGSAHWRLSSIEHGVVPKSPCKPLPVVRDPRTVVRIALGQARMLHMPRRDDTVGVHVILIAGDLRSAVCKARIGCDTLMNSRDTLDIELEMTRVLEELSKVRMEPVSAKAKKAFSA